MLKGGIGVLENPYLRHLIMGVGVTALLFALREILQGRRPTEQDGDCGRIAPNAHLIGAIGITGLAFALSALTSAVSGSGGIAAWVVGIASLVTAALSLASLRPGYDILWDEEGIEGPITNFVPLKVPQRARLYWEDLADLGSDSGNWFIQDIQGRRIRWNSLYAGYPIFMARVEDECPWLFDEALA